MSDHTVILAFKRASIFSKSQTWGNTIKFFIGDCWYVHVELVLLKNCDGCSSCYYCNVLLKEGRKKIHQQSYQKKHTLSYLVSKVPHHKVGCLIDREFDASYDFYSIECSYSGYNSIVTFLQNQEDVPFQSGPEAQWLLRNTISLPRLITKIPLYFYKPRYTSRKLLFYNGSTKPHSGINKQGWFCSELIATALSRVFETLQVDNPDMLYGDLNQLGILQPMDKSILMSLTQSSSYHSSSSTPAPYSYTPPMPHTPTISSTNTKPNHVYVDLSAIGVSARPVQRRNDGLSTILSQINKR